MPPDPGAFQYSQLSNRFVGGPVLVLNGRPMSMIARNLVEPSNYLALAQAAVVYEQPVRAVARYFFGYDTYPRSVRLRTPLGPMPVTLFGGHDAVTVHEVFCRHDYRVTPIPRTVVDLGSNIGISALYFLTRSPSTYCFLYEPDPRNIEKLLSNLSTFKDRFSLYPSAVADREGVLPFSRESTGRYGSLDPAPWVRTVGETVEVQVEHVNDVLDRALSKTGVIDLLKIDTEGSELATIRAIDPALRTRIRHMVIEWRDHKIVLDGFDTRSKCDAVLFTNRGFRQRS